MVCQSAPHTVRAMKTALTDRTMSKHTPGPWKADYNKPYDQWWVSQFDGNPVATTKQETNARLIAAAPDLLAALKNLLDASERIVIARGKAANHDDARRAASAAIAKAEGTS